MDRLIDKYYCEHEWWEDTVYTESSSSYKLHICRFCGDKRKIQKTPEEMAAAGYSLVTEELTN